MFAPKGSYSFVGRAAVMVMVAAVALTAVEPSMALAGSALSGKGLSAATATSDATDFSARRRYFGPAAAFAGIVGTGIAIAAAAPRRTYYYDDYYGGPVYYGADPYYYGGPVYYGGPPYYGGYTYGAPYTREFPIP